MACSCTPPLYPGDQNHCRNCRKHNRQRPGQRVATAYRRSTPQWMSGPCCTEYDCGSYADESGTDGSMTCQPVMWDAYACTQSAWAFPQACGCDSCATAMTGDWSVNDPSMEGPYYGTADQGSAGCGCGEQISSDGSLYLPEVNDTYEYSGESPPMSFPVDGESSSDPRTFSPTPPNDTPTSPGPSNSGAAKPLTVPPASGENVPMPQDMTPKESPKNAPGSFDPLGEEAAPAADNVLDPVSYDLPRIPPIPARVRSVVKRSGPSTVRPIATNAQQFQR